MKKLRALRAFVVILSVLSGCAEFKSIPVRLYRAGFEVKRLGLASAQVLDAKGTVVRSLWKDKAVDAGALTLAWDGKDDKGETVGPGTYQEVISLQRWDLKPVGNFGGLGSTTGRFLSPKGLCAYPQGARLTVAVADTGNQRIQILTDTGGFLQAAGDFGSGNEKLSQPTDVDWDGQILTVCDSQNHRLARFDGQGVYLGEVRQLTGLQATASRSTPLGLEEPRSIRKGGGATFWVSDRGKGMLALLTSTGGILQAFGDTYPLGNEGPFFELQGAFFIQTGSRTIQKINSNDKDIQEVKVEPPFQAVAGMAASAQGFGVVSDSQRNLLYFMDKEGKVFETLVPEGVAKAGALSFWQENLFLVDADQNRIFHYQLVPAPSSNIQQKIKLSTADVGSSVP